MFSCGNQAQGNDISLKARHYKSNAHLWFSKMLWRNDLQERWRWKQTPVIFTDRVKYCESSFLLCFHDFSYKIFSVLRSYLRKLDESCISFNILPETTAHIIRSSFEEIQLRNSLSTQEFFFPVLQFNTAFCLKPRNLHPFQFKNTLFMPSKINKNHISSVEVFTFCLKYQARYRIQLSLYLR